MTTFAPVENRKLTNAQLGRISPEEYARLPHSGVVLLLDNVRSAYNVGSAFRTCDAFKVDRLFLCGISACPPSAEIHKTALGAELSVPWTHVGDTLEAVSGLRSEGYRIICVEQVERPTLLQDFVPDPGEKYALVFGNEVDGVRQDVIDSADSVVEIPQFGTKHSLNVSVSVGVVLWHMTFCHWHGH